MLAPEVITASPQVPDPVLDLESTAQYECLGEEAKTFAIGSGSAESSLVFPLQEVLGNAGCFGSHPDGSPVVEQAAVVCIEFFRVRFRTEQLLEGDQPGVLPMGAAMGGTPSPLFGR